MRFSAVFAAIALAASASAATIEGKDTLSSRSQILVERQGAGSNANRPVPDGACCVANTNLKQDFCTVNGQQGKCVPASSAGCKFYESPFTSRSQLTDVSRTGNDKLTCVADADLTCNPNVLERGRPLCRPT
jgi:hypothetical protein